MADTRDPREEYSHGVLDKSDDIQNIDVPDGVDRAKFGSDYYAVYTVYKNGDRVIQWFKRGTGDGTKDPVLKTTQDTVAAVKKTWDDETTKNQQTAGKTERRKYPGTDPSTGLPAIVTEYDDGTKSYDSSSPTTASGRATVGRVEGTPIPGGGFDNSKPIWVERDDKNQQVGPAKPLTAEQRQQWEKDTGRAQGDSGGVIYRKNPQTGQLEKVTTTTVNGVTSTKVEPVDPKDRVAIGAKTVVNGTKTTKVTTWQLPDGSTMETTEEDQAAPKPGTIVKGQGKNGEDVQAIDDPDHPGQIKYVPIPGAQIPAANQPIPKGAPTFTPDYTKDDLGLTAYNEQLLQASQSGVITRQQGAQLLEQAGALAQTTATHGNTLRSQDSATRGQDITQRGQDLSEVGSRRTAADTGFDNLLSGFSAGAPHLGRGNGGLAAAAFREALLNRQTNATNAGGYADVAQVPGPISPAVQAVRTTMVHPDGTVQVSHPVETPAASGAAIGPVAAGVTATNAAAINPTGENVQAATDATMAGSNAAFGAVGVGPGTDPPGVRTGANMTGTGVDDPVAPVGQVPAYLQAARAPLWNPDPVVADLKARGFSDDVIQQALAEHHQDWNAA